MTKEELKKDFYKYLKDSSDYYDPREPLTERKLLQMWLDCAEPREKRIAELEAQIEKLIDFVISKTECCDVCPITDTCINSEGTCPYAGILAKGEEEVTMEWLMQFISRR